MRKRDSKSFSEVAKSEGVQNAKKRAEARKAKAAKATKPTAEESLLASSWGVNQWINFVEATASEFDVPLSPKASDNIYKKRNIYKKFVDEGTTICGTPQLLVVAVANLLSTWEEEKYPFLRCRPSEFNVSYFTKALDSYRKTIERSPLLVESYTTISDTFTARIGSYIGEENNTKAGQTKPQVGRTRPATIHDTYQDQLLKDIL